MKFIYNNLKIQIDIRNGMYRFDKFSGTGKTYLYKAAEQLYMLDGTLIGYGYSDFRKGIQIQNLYKPNITKCIVLDRYDHYKSEDIDRFLCSISDKCVVLIDIKGQYNYALESVKIQLNKDRIEVGQYGSSF